MGKYVRKTKLTGEIAVMAVAHQPPLGVRTRARTLALQRLQRSASPVSTSPSPADLTVVSYLQLRSRRLEKPSAATASAAATAISKDAVKPGATGSRAAAEAKSAKSRVAPCSANSGPESSKNILKKAGREKREAGPAALSGSGGVEASFGENVLEELEAEDRDVKETTPCSLTRDSDITETPGSTTKPRTASSKRHGRTLGNMPTTEEMESFFSDAELLQQRMFTEKYNFDPVNNCPLPGRYQWVRLSC